MVQFRVNMVMRLNKLWLVITSENQYRIFEMNCCVPRKEKKRKRKYCRNTPDYARLVKSQGG